MDALQYYTNEEARLTALFAEEKKAALQKPLGVAFVTFGWLSKVRVNVQKNYENILFRYTWSRESHEKAVAISSVRALGSGLGTSPVRHLLGKSEHPQTLLVSERDPDQCSPVPSHVFRYDSKCEYNFFSTHRFRFYC